LRAAQAARRKPRNKTSDKTAGQARKMSDRPMTQGTGRSMARWIGRTVLLAMVVAQLAVAAASAQGQSIPVPPPRPTPPTQVDAEAPAADNTPEAPESVEQVPAPAVALPAAPLPEPTLAAPTRGAVTNLPLPRFVSLKTAEGNARRGPSLAHRIDWVFTRPGMPLRITAEYENWRRVEDADGVGGWVHYALLSGTRSTIVIVPLADMRAEGNEASRLLARLEAGVIGRILSCTPDWCRISTDGGRGWVRKTAIWGVTADEVIE
jgi:SH3-like domain-containing protein